MRGYLKGLNQHFLKFFLHSAGPFAAAPFEKLQQTLILAFKTYSALSCENETKIVKIAPSARTR